MNLEEVKNVMFLWSLGYVTLIASVLTLIGMGLWKVILKKRGVLNDTLSAEAKDELLTRSGRIIALVLYAGAYLLNQYLLKKSIEFNEALMIGLVSGGALTLTTAKGIYTALRQRQKKKQVYQKLTEAQQAIETVKKSNKSWIISNK